jgi:hypothetical protein
MTEAFDLLEEAGTSLLGRYVPMNPFRNWTEPMKTNPNIFDDIAYNVDVSTFWKTKVWTRDFKCKANCITVLITFPLLFLFHLFMMIFPLGWWCGSNIVLFFYTLYIMFQMMISLGYAIESPLIINNNYKTRLIPIIIGYVTSGIWVVQCITVLIKLCIHGDMFKEAEDIVGAYFIILGIPPVVFSIYNAIRNEWWYWYHNGIGSVPYTESNYHS